MLWGNTFSLFPAPRLDNSVNSIPMPTPAPWQNYPQNSEESQ